MRHTALLIVFMIMQVTTVIYAEGTRELAPHQEIAINGVLTEDIAALFIGAEAYGDFANYITKSENRLHVRIEDPSSECIYFGFKGGLTEMLGGRSSFIIHVFDPNGNEIYVSELITGANQHIDTWSEAYNGPKELVGPQGYDAGYLSSADLMMAGWNAEGDYYFEFENPLEEDGYILELWDITVASCATSIPTPKPGRVWSSNWALYSPHFMNFFDRPFNGSFYVAAPDETDPGAAFITKMDFDGSQFRGAAFNVALNSFGSRNTGNINEDRKSVTGINTVVGEYPVFLNDPVDIFRTAEVGTLELIPSIGCLPDDFCLMATANKTGTLEILVDLHGDNGVYDQNTIDIILYFQVEEEHLNAPFCIPWDGMDGLGRYYFRGNFDSIGIYATYGQGVYHFPVFDVEINRIGFVLESIRPAVTAPLLYYDDRDINRFTNTGSPRVNLQGCTTPCHTWYSASPPEGYGNNNTINSWWFGELIRDSHAAALRYSKEKGEFEQQICVGDTLILGDQMITESGEYEIRFNTFQGCDSIVLAHIEAIDPQAVINANNVELNCDYPTIMLNARPSRPYGNLIYSWNGPDGPISQEANTLIVEINSPGEYNLSIEDARVDNCVDETSIVISENFERPIIEDISVPEINCYNDEETIFLDIQGELAAHSIQWSSTTGSIISDPNAQNAVINRAGNYVVELKLNASGCVVREEFDVSATEPYLTIIETAEDHYPFCEEAFLEVSVVPPIYDSITWQDESGLLCSQCTSIGLLVNQSKLIDVTAIDTNGCQTSITFDINTDDYKIYLPNAFSPNNDGINDVFRPFSSPCAVDVIQFVVFDRWGSRVFERRDFSSTDDVSWNGSVLDKKADSGLYVYQMMIKNSRNEEFTLSGDVQLMR